MVSFLRNAALALICLTVLTISGANAAPYRAMALDGGYRMTARHDGTELEIAWRPFADGSAPVAGAPISPSNVAVRGERGIILPIPGSQAAFLKTRVDLSVVLDTRDENALFDQLSAIRVMLAAADFTRQTWRFYDASSPSAPLAKIAADTDLASGWAALRALLSSRSSAADIGAVAQIIQQLAAAPGDRKALILPHSLMPTLKPGLTPQGIAGLQAFGISLYPMIGALPGGVQAAYKTLAGATGGHTLPWLIVPPDVATAKAAFAPLMAGGMARYPLPDAPRQPWKTPPPLQVLLSSAEAPALRMDIPLPASAWSDLPWGVIGGLAALLLVCGALAIIWLRRQNRQLLRARIIDTATGRHYDLLRWPATLGRGEDADITIANAHLAPLHIRFSDNGTGIELRAVAEGASIQVGGQDKREHSVYRDTQFETAGLVFQIEFLTKS